MGDLDMGSLQGKIINCDERSYTQTIQSSINFLLCGYCLPEFINIIKTTSLRNPYNPHAFNPNIERHFFPSFPSIKNCLNDPTSFVQDENDNKLPTSLEHCLYAEYTNFGYICVKCKDGRIGRVVRAKKTSSGTAITESLFVIKECKDESTQMTTRYQGLGYHNFDLNLLPYSTYVAADSCTDPAKGKFHFNLEILAKWVIISRSCICWNASKWGQFELKNGRKRRNRTA
jgi:hypothetical protein